ncbi:uncharacterized protein BJ171DRAFT_500856 [Polychytrium aggregatum]|uniref:uncharacterized protein n=1 Tax=Polychytrium aggregatum TaxID=110093 RepID=UPI0022FE6A22|nr:uncharacterized protein BJ171DRAFT_500856 [Polychytrium aggregatum]KAI9205586.1 hypothetical protein BJ171DRAFT_500856 [Polychytrium aggregatum]
MGVKLLTSYLRDYGENHNILNPTLVSGRLLLVDAGSLKRMFAVVTPALPSEYRINQTTMGQYHELRDRIVVFFQKMLDAGLSVVLFSNCELRAKHDEEWVYKPAQFPWTNSSARGGNYPHHYQQQQQQQNHHHNHHRDQHPQHQQQRSAQGGPEDENQFQSVVNIRTFLESVALEHLKPPTPDSFKLHRCKTDLIKEMARYAQDVAPRSQLLGIMSSNSEFGIYCSILNTSWYRTPEEFPQELLSMSQPLDQRRLTAMCLTPLGFRNAYGSLHGNARLLALLAVMSSNDYVDYDSAKAIRMQVFEGRANYKIPHTIAYLSRLDHRSDPVEVVFKCLPDKDPTNRRLKQLMIEGMIPYNLNKPATISREVKEKLNENIPAALHPVFIESKVGRTVMSIGVFRRLCMDLTGEIDHRGVSSWDIVSPLFQRIYWVVVGQGALLNELIRVEAPVRKVVKIFDIDDLMTMEELLQKDRAARIMNVCRICDPDDAPFLYQALFSDESVFSPTLTQKQTSTLQLVTLTLYVLIKATQSRTPFTAFDIDVLLLCILVELFEEARVELLEAHGDLAGDPLTWRGLGPCYRMPSLDELCGELKFVSTFWFRMQSAVLVATDACFRPLDVTSIIGCYDGYGLHLLYRRFEGAKLKPLGLDGPQSHFCDMVEELLAPGSPCKSVLMDSYNSVMSVVSEAKKRLEAAE